MSKTLPYLTLAKRPTENPLQHNPRRVLYRFSYFVVPHSTTRSHKYWINQHIYRSKPIKFNIKLYTDHNALWVKHATHQKALRVFKSRFSFKVRQHNQQNLYLQYKVCWIIYKMVGAPSFSQPYLCMQPPWSIH